MTTVEFSFCLAEKMKMKYIAVLCVVLLSTWCHAAISDLESCKNMFTSDKEYVKQMYLREHKGADPNSLSVDSWGCHNTSNCCYYDGYWGWGWGWGAGVVAIFFCVFIFFIIVALIGLLFVSPSSCETPYGPAYRPVYLEGCTYVYRSGTFVMIMDNNKSK